nr:hypothetical protein [Pseudodesulfovibrio sp.]
MTVYQDRHFTTTKPDADGLPLYGLDKSDTTVLACSFGICSDEQVAVGQGATRILLVDCVFRDNEKGILIGTGDAVDYEAEKEAEVFIRDMDVDNVSRRIPYGRYGSFLIEGGSIRNWHGGVKTYAMRFEQGARVIIRDVHFHQDRFRFEPMQWLRALLYFKNWRWKGQLLGGWTAVVADGSCEIVMENCTRNKWWIRWSGKGITHKNCRTVKS